MAILTSPSPYGLASTKSRKEYLYTKGFQYSLDGVNYIGEYHIEGRLVKTGPVQSPESKELTKYYSDPMLYDYDKARNFPKRVRVEPNQIVWSPLETNYKTGFATRYFVERIAEFDGYPIEIDQEQKDSFGNEEGIDEGVYSLVTLSWKLTGSERDVFKNGQLYIQGIYEYNQAQVILNTRTIPNLESAIKSYTEYAKITLA
tara:strand:+ start:1093 stop:1698 length:606 start_codon:yes stop_codon:yes gene_type:complete